MYKTDASFAELLPTGLPYTYIVCAHCEEEKTGVHGHRSHRAPRCVTFHVGDFCTNEALHACFVTGDLVQAVAAAAAAW